MVRESLFGASELVRPISSRDIEERRENRIGSDAISGQLRQRGAHERKVSGGPCEPERDVKLRWREQAGLAVSQPSQRARSDERPLER